MTYAKQLQRELDIRSTERFYTGGTKATVVEATERLRHALDLMATRRFLRYCLMLDLDERRKKPK